MLDADGLAYRVNPRLVRGMDYYNLTVFEWVTDQLGAQGTVCGGGRYDGLIEQLGGKPAPAVGLGLGVERLLLTGARSWACRCRAPAPDAYAVVPDAARHCRWCCARLRGLARRRRQRADARRPAPTAWAA